MGKSFQKRGTTVVVSPDIIRDEISAVILQFSDGQLATAGGRTKEQAKKVKSGKSAPSSATLINWARNIPAVHDWLTGMIASGDGKPIESNPNTLIEVLTHLRRMSETDTPEGRALKQIFQQIGQG